MDDLFESRWRAERQVLELFVGPSESFRAREGDDDPTASLRAPLMRCQLPLVEGCYRVTRSSS